MRIRNPYPSTPASGGQAVGEPKPARQAGGSARVGAPAGAEDTATVAGIPEAELTPKVRAALEQLMSEVHRLREELELAKRRIQHLEDLADLDALVPVANRRAFVRELSRLMAFAERYGAPGSVIYFDINGMKEINDTFGHNAGDAAIRHVSEILVRNVRGSDVVGRLGGDEFGVILTQSDQSTAAAKANALAIAITKSPLDWEGQAIDIEISFGSYSFAGNEGVDEALAAADRAMYEHKRTRDSGS